MRIPFDSFALAAITTEVQHFVGGRIQEIRQPNEFDLYLHLYHRGREGALLLCCHPVYARAHFATRRVPVPQEPYGFCKILRARVQGATLSAAWQAEGDRVLYLNIEAPHNQYRLVAELMGKHSNLVLHDASGLVHACSRVVHRKQSRRPMHAGGTYEDPPVLGGGGFSSFAIRLAEAMGVSTEELVRFPKDPHWYPSIGAYPISAEPLGLKGLRRESLSIALEQYTNEWIKTSEFDERKRVLLQALERAFKSRKRSLEDVQRALHDGSKADRLRLHGELLLAYASQIDAGCAQAELKDYEGNDVLIHLDPERTVLENADVFFAKSKKSRLGMRTLQEQQTRISEEISQIEMSIHAVTGAVRDVALADVEDLARRKHWMQVQTVRNSSQEKPFDGHRIRTFVAPHGWTVLVGENAQANDYLTMRLAKGSDYWFHVRGQTSAHAVIPTSNQPQRVSPEAIRFAAEITAANSPLKHSQFVPVDYTLKKYVRKPKGSPLGTVSYTNEKTLHVQPWKQK